MTVTVGAIIHVATTTTNGAIIAATGGPELSAVEDMGVMEGLGGDGVLGAVVDALVMPITQML